MNLSLKPLAFSGRDTENPRTHSHPNHTTFFKVMQQKGAFQPKKKCHQDGIKETTFCYFFFCRSLVCHTHTLIPHSVITIS